MRRHKIDILQAKLGADGKPEKDEFGELTGVYEVYKSNVWAEKQGVVGSEFYSSLTTGNKVDVKFETGYVQGITSEMRIKHSNDLYEIIGPPINIGDKNLKLLFYCRAVV
jgi:SPP1 family predicted phage head-tail adaptor